MKKLTILMLGLVIASIGFAANADLINKGQPETSFRVPRLGPAPVITGHRAPAVLVDTIRMDALNPIGYCWGVAYDWERDGIWVTQWNSSYNKMYCIEKHSPTVKIDSVVLGSGVPSYRLGIGYGGSNTMYMAGYNSSVYAINMATGAGSVYRSMPWSTAEGYDYNLASDANYACDWTANACAWAKPAQSGSWTTWSVNPYPSGMTGGYHATAQPTKLFMVDESGPPCNLFQYTMTNGVPNTTPESTWTLDAAMTGVSTADCAFDGQYVYVLDQNGADGRIWVYDVGIQMDDTIRWTFETGLQGWTHTATTVFPNGWGVAPSGLHAGYVCPTPGDSSLWFDDDAAGSGAPSLSDTALSPVIVPNPATTHKLKWGIAYRRLSSGEIMEVGVKYFTGSAWVVRPMRTYTANVAGIWDSVFVDSLINYPRLQVYAFYYDGGGWQWYGAIDNITINGELYVAQHDVRTASIDAPGSRIPPNSVQTPTATFRNVGNNNEDFSVHYVIDSLGTVIYNNTVNLVGIVPAAETTIVFPNWTCGSGDGFIYNLTAFTVLAGDANPANDTLHGTTSISTVSNWIQCADMPTAEECHATAYDPEHDKVYTFGGYHGDNTYQNYTYQFDPVANTWATMAPLPTAIDWIDASYVRGKFYIFGGFTGAPNTYNYIYDVAGNSWSTGAAVPNARIAGGQMIYKDSLIYFVGGYNGSAPTTNVQIYNTYTNAWTTGTALPQADMMCGVAMTGDTLWLVGGYSGSCYATLYYGIINPANCQQITWSTGSNLAVPNFNNGATMMNRNGNWYLYIVGGFENASTITNKAWEYNVGADTWNALPDYPFTVTRNDVLVSREGHNEIYVCGGDNSGGWTENAQVWKLQWMVPPGAEEKPGSTPKVAFGFAPNMNPIRNRVTLSYATPVAGNVSLKVYDGMGRLVKVLVQGVQLAGAKTATWDLKDDTGRSIMSGVYFVRLESNGQAMSQKLVIVK